MAYFVDLLMKVHYIIKIQNKKNKHVRKKIRLNYFILIKFPIPPCNKRRKSFC